VDKVVQTLELEKSRAVDELASTETATQLNEQLLMHQTKRRIAAQQEEKKAKEEAENQDIREENDVGESDSNDESDDEEAREAKQQAWGMISADWKQYDLGDAFDYREPDSVRGETAFSGDRMGNADADSEFKGQVTDPKTDMLE
jgi:hypothetical protein